MQPSEPTAREKETTVGGYGGMRKQRLLKEDGRYIIFYEFGYEGPEGEHPEATRGEEGSV